MDDVTPRATSRQLPRILGYAVVLAGSIDALWLAFMLLPKSAYYVRLYPLTEVPQFCSVALGPWLPDVDLVLALLITAGVVLLVGALLHPKHARLTSLARTGLAVLTGAVTLLALYLLVAGYVAMMMATTAQTRELNFYRRELEEFALLEAAEGRLEQIRQWSKERQGLKLVEMKSAAEFNEDEAWERISELLRAVAKSKNPAVSKRGLATVALFRERIIARPHVFAEVPRLATQAGAPVSKSAAESLEWIAAQAGKNGWEPLPLFKLTK